MILEYDFLKAFEKRNKIEEDRLKFEKEAFEFNKQLNIDDTNTNKSVAKTLEEYTNIFQSVNDAVKILSQNQAILHQQMQELKACLESHEATK